jgi:hypothetical protein
MPPHIPITNPENRGTQVIVPMYVRVKFNVYTQANKLERAFYTIKVILTPMKAEILSKSQ